MFGPSGSTVGSSILSHLVLQLVTLMLSHLVLVGNSHFESSGSTVLVTLFLSNLVLLLVLKLATLLLSHLLLPLLALISIHLVLTLW